jgi:hypothetical protein
MSTQTAEVVESQRALSMLGGALRRPEDVLAEAQACAAALRDVIALKPKKVMMNGEQYLEFEDWQTVAYFYGITAQEDGDPEFVDFGGVRGFKVSGIAVDRHGRTLSRATAFCLSDEEKWSTRPKYAWHYVTKAGGLSADDPGPDEIVWEDNPDKPGRKRPKKQKVADGEESVPLFQLSSMAQTRANAKALRNILSWVVVLAGYRSTPAEELDGKTTVEENGDRSPKQTQQRPAQQGATGPAAQAAKPGPTPAAAGTPKHGERWTKPCPRCGKTECVIVSKRDPGWHCWAKSTKNGGGCGYSFTEADIAVHEGAAADRAAQTTIPADPPLNPVAADDPFGTSLDGPDAETR